MASRVLLTNDDGIWAEGLQALYRELRRFPQLDVRVVAPDGNRSAAARAITVRRPITVKEETLADGASAFATDGQPTDCVRLAMAGLVPDWKPDLVVSGINHGANVASDVTYSGTVAAALEAVIHDLPGVAVSMVSPFGEWGLRKEHKWDFSHAAAIGASVVSKLEVVRGDGSGIAVEPGTILNVNAPLQEAKGVRVTRLGRRHYIDELNLVSEADDGSRSYWLYGLEHHHELHEGTDLSALHDGYVSVTPLRLDLTDVEVAARLDSRAFA